MSNLFETSGDEFPDSRVIIQIHGDTLDLFPLLFDA